MFLSLCNKRLFLLSCGTVLCNSTMKSYITEWEACLPMMVWKAASWSLAERTSHSWVFLLFFSFLSSVCSVSSVFNNHSSDSCD